MVLKKSLLKPTKMNALYATDKNDHPWIRLPIATRKQNITGEPIINGNHGPLTCTTAKADERKKNPTKKHSTYDNVVRDTPDPRRKIAILPMEPDTPSPIIMNVKPLYAIIPSHDGLVVVARSLATRKPMSKWHRNTNYLISIMWHTGHRMPQDLYQVDNTRNRNQHCRRH